MEDIFDVVLHYFVPYLDLFNCAFCIIFLSEIPSSLTQWNVSVTMETRLKRKLKAEKIIILGL